MSAGRELMTVSRTASIQMAHTHAAVIPDLLSMLTEEIVVVSSDLKTKWINCYSTH
jgi:hypothetical protein